MIYLSDSGALALLYRFGHPRNMERIGIVEALSALGQTTRWAVFEALGDAGPAGMAAGELAQQVGTPASTMSVHLAILASAGLVEIRQTGTTRNYRLEIDRAAEVIAAISAAAGRALPKRGAKRSA